MPSTETVERFIARVEQNIHARRLRRITPPMQESQSPPGVAVTR